MGRNYIYIVTNESGISITVIAVSAEKANVFVELAGHKAVETRKVGKAHPSCAAGIVD